MPKPELDAEVLMTTPGLAENLRDDERERLAEWLQARRGQAEESLLMKIFVGVGAWFAAMFLMVFVVASLTVAEEAGAILCGAGLLAIAVPLLRKPDAVFLNQMALAFALAGNALLMGGIVFLIDEGLLTAVIVQTVIAAATYGIIRHAAYRFVAAGAVHVLVFIWCIDDALNAVNLLILVQIALVAWLLLKQQLVTRYLPLLYVSVISIACEILVLNYMTQDWFLGEKLDDLNLLPALLGFAAGLAYLVWRLGARWQTNVNATGLAILLVILLAGFTSAGVMFGLLLLTAAYMTADRALAIMAAFFMPAFLFFYYYAMDVTLAYKSSVIAGSGLLLLAARYLLSLSASKEQEHA